MFILSWEDYILDSSILDVATLKLIGYLPALKWFT